MMTQFPKIQARFDAALSNLAEAARQSSNESEVKANAARITELEAELSSAKDAAQKANERFSQMESKLATATKNAEAQRLALVEQIDTIDKARNKAEEQLINARQFNKQLKKLNAGLRKQNEENVGDADLINSSLEAELMQIKAQRDVDLEEINGILARMTPLVEGN